jgi:hypothetical protein
VLLVGLTPAFAQDNTLGLSDADFTLYTQANSYSFDGLAFDYSFTMSINNQTVTLTGSGSGGSDASGSPVGQLTLTGGGLFDLEGTGTPQQVSADNEFRLVGNTLYLIDNNSDQGWQGVALEDALNSIAGDTLGIDPQALAEGDMSALGDFGSALDDVSSLMDSGFAKMTRLPDANVNGANVAHFQMVFDFDTLLSSDFLKQVLVGSGQLSGTDEEIDQQFQFFASFLGAFLQGINLSFDQYVAVDTPRVEQATLTFGITVPAMSEDSEEMAINLVLDVTMTEYNPMLSVEVPANVTMIDPNELMQEANSSLGGS